MLHVSDIKRYYRCHRLYSYYQTEPNKRGSFFSFFNFKINIDESLREKLGIEACFDGSRNDGNDVFFSHKDEYQWFHNVRFEYRGLRIKVPYLYIDETRCDIYDPLVTTTPSLDEALSLRIMIEVLHKVGISVNDVHILYLNKKYIRGKKFCAKEQWILTDFFVTPKGNKRASISEAIKRYDFDLDAMMDEMEQYQIDPHEQVKKIGACSGKNMCEYFHKCFPGYENPTSDSILHLIGCAQKQQMYEEGIVRLQDVDVEKIEGGRMQYAQIQAAKQGGLYVEKLALKHWLKSISRDTMVFLDFEWDTYALPPYLGMHAIQTLPFQYSMHIYRNGVEEHKEFLGVNDCREEFLYHLFRDLPQDGVICAYNAQGAEIIRLLELKEQFPKYKSQIDDCISRMVDLALPFENGLVYDLRMHGSFSLKALSAMLHPDHNYHELDVSDGLKAVLIHRKIEESAEDTDHDEAHLLSYCAMDTSELKAVYDWLVEISE